MIIVSLIGAPTASLERKGEEQNEAGRAYYSILS
jgi:hypothetical protein